MPIDNLLLEKTTIKFPKPLNLKGSEKLLEYISKKLPGDVNYTVNYYSHFLYNKERKKSLKSNGTIGITANIISSKEAMAFWDTSMLSSNENLSRLSSMEFSKVPGWDIADYRPEVQGLWDDVRKIVEDYFKEREFLRI